MPNTERINTQLDKALTSVDEYLNAGGQGRAERAIASALDNLIEAVRELVGPTKAAAKTTASTEPKHKAPAKKAPAKKAAKS